MMDMQPFFFLNDTATTEIYTLALHDALPIWFTFSGTGLGLAITRKLVSAMGAELQVETGATWGTRFYFEVVLPLVPPRSEEHTSELQSQSNLVCRLLLEKKNTFDIVRVFHWR